MTETRLERYEKRTDWPLAAVALTFLGLYSVRVLAQLRGGAAEAIEDALIALYLYSSLTTSRGYGSPNRVANGSADTYGSCRSSCSRSSVRCAC
jgi:hypothetical protein